MVLCFGFVVKMGLITQGYFGYCLHNVKAFSLSSSALPPLCLLPQTRLGVGKRVGETQLGQLTQTDRRDVLCHIVTCSAITAQRKEDKTGKVMVMTFFFLSRHYMR